MAVSTGSVDYLTRSAAPLPEPPADVAVTAAAVVGPEIVVAGIGRYDKAAVPQPGVAWQLPTQDLTTALHGHGMPFELTVEGTPDRVELRLATWSPQRLDAAELARRTGVLESALHGLYPQVRTARREPRPLDLPLGGLALGVPSARRPDQSDPALPWDRLLRATSGTRWAVRVVAMPAAERLVGALRDSVVNEMREVLSAARAEPSPLADHYVALLERSLAALTEGLTAGCWRTAAYLLGDDEGYPRLAAAWRATFGGPESAPEPVRVFALDAAPRLAAAFAMPEVPGPPGPGRYRRPAEYQTLLTSGALAAYVHLPHEEAPGYPIDTVARFDTVPPVAGEAAVRLGTVRRGAVPTTTPYAVDVAALTRHVFVGGVTGSGKTTTIQHLLREAGATGVPWLVIEPAKTEYRHLLGEGVRVFTVGDERVSPLRLNPFEVPEGIPVGVHVDLLRTVFNAGLGMWTPLPQVLERCLYEVYLDQGWDFATGRNPRADGGRAPAPTLTDLALKVADVVPRLGYEEKTTAEIRAALLTRLDALRLGAKGRMFDTPASVAMEELLAAPTVIELEALGDDDDKAFTMALLLVRLVEHRRVAGPSRDLRHLLVVEEAHRLLGAPPQRGEFEADPKGKVVETFAHLLSEIRAYGQGIVIADQVPVRLAPDALKNTNLKIAHRVVAADDRAALAAAMAMDERQSNALATLPRGVAAVFGAGDDAPVLVEVPPPPPAAAVTPRDVAERMAAWRATRPELRTPPACDEACVAEPAACDEARRLVAEPAVRAAVERAHTAAVVAPESLDAVATELVDAVRARRGARVPEAALLRAVCSHAAYLLAARRGAQGQWLQSEATAYARALAAALTGATSGAGTGAAAEFARAAAPRYARTTDPFAGCVVVCHADLGACRFRHAVADVVAAGEDVPAWREALAAYDVPRLRQVAADAADRVVPRLDAGPGAAALAVAREQAAGCFAQAMTYADPLELPHRRARLLHDITHEEEQHV